MSSITGVLRRRSDLLLFMVLGTSLTLNVFQYYSQLKTKAASTSRLEQPRDGVVLSSLHLVSVDGTKLQMSFGTATLPTVIYVMSPKCKWCKFNLPMVNRLATHLKGKYRLIGISLHLDKQSPSTAYSFPLYELDSSFAAPPITLDATPRTLIFSPDGHFVKGWDGAYVDRTEREIDAFFSVDLSDKQ